METKKIEQLIEKFFEGKTSLEEEKMLRAYFSSGEVPGHLQSYIDLFRYYETMGKQHDDLDLFAKVEETESGVTSSSAPNRTILYGRGMTWTLRVAAGLILLLIGFSAGLLLNRSQADRGEELAALQKEVQQMKSALIYQQQASASERISAVKQTVRMDGGRSSSTDIGREITDILVYTMNNDENVNVRQAAAEALFHFKEEPAIRRALVNSLPRQEEPLMQMTLIDMLVEMREKSAVNEMQKLLMESDTREIVKTRLQGGIAELKNT